MLLRNCSPQSQRKLPNRSPVRHAEWSRTGTMLGQEARSPKRIATCSRSPLASRKSMKRASSASSSGTRASLTCVISIPPVLLAAALWTSRLSTLRMARLSIAARKAVDRSGSASTVIAAGTSPLRRTIASAAASSSEVGRAPRASAFSLPMALAMEKSSAGRDPFTLRLIPAAARSRPSDSTPIALARRGVTTSLGLPAPSLLSSSSLRLSRPSTAVNSTCCDGPCAEVTSRGRPRLSSKRPRSI